jgi:hypothetical protein
VGGLTGGNISGGCRVRAAPPVVTLASLPQGLEVVWVRTLVLER